MAESIDRYFRMVTLARKSRPAPARLWRPAADVYQTSNGWIVKFDLAGVAVDVLEIEIQDQTLRMRCVVRRGRLLPSTRNHLQPF
jgi:HSP20 family molecular chaperone IbpA